MNPSLEVLRGVYRDSGEYVEARCHEEVCAVDENDRRIWSETGYDGIVESLCDHDAGGCGGNDVYDGKSAMLRWRA